MIFFSLWAWFILSAYVVVWLLVVWRRLQGERNVTQPQLLTVSEHEAVVFHGARPTTLPGILLLTSSFFWATVGSVIAYGALGMLGELQVSTSSPVGTIILAELAIACLFVGYCVWNAFGQWGIAVDREGKTVTAWWGFLTPLFRKTFSMQDFTAVGIARQRKRFLVKLEGKGRSVLIDGTICRSHETALQLAGELAAFAGWDVHDDVPEKWRK